MPGLIAFTAVLIHMTFFYVDSIKGLYCHECGHMYDGATFMGIQSFDECQFFEHDIAENGNKFLKECPENEKCCFSLREHMAIEFWGHAAAAEVFVHGCCSSLNKTTHHLTSATPPPLVTTNIYRAEILSQTIQNGDIKTRVLFCNTLGCNNQRVAWSEPVTVLDRQPRVHEEQLQSSPRPSNSPNPRRGVNPDVPIRSEKAAVEIATKAEMNKLEVPINTQSRTFHDEASLLALLDRSVKSKSVGTVDESQRNIQGRRVEVQDFLTEMIKAEKEKEVEELANKDRLAKEDLLRELAIQMGLPQNIVPSTTSTTTEQPQNLVIVGGFNQTRFVPSMQNSKDSPVCECQCSCPALICPTFQLPFQVGRANGNHHGFCQTRGALVLAVAWTILKLI